MNPCYLRGLTTLSLPLTQQFSVAQRGLLHLHSQASRSLNGWKDLGGKGQDDYITGQGQGLWRDVGLRWRVERGWTLASKDPGGVASALLRSPARGKTRPVSLTLLRYLTVSVKCYPGFLWE